MRRPPQARNARLGRPDGALSRRDPKRSELLLRARLTLATVICALFLQPAQAVRAADYVLGPEDVIQVSVWLHPELERSLTIRADGSVTLPPVGDLKAGGLTPKEFADRASDRLSSYLRQTTTVTVTVTQYMSRSVFVQGAVAKPGRFGFENIPTLVDLLAQAGRALPGANLAGVQVVRGVGDS